MWEDRKKQELKEAAMHHAKTPSKDCDRGLFSNSRHPMLSSWIQSRKLTITIKSILLFQSIKKVLPSSLRGSCNIRVAAGQGQGPRVRAGMSLEGRVRAQMLGPQVRAGPKLEARP